MDIELIKRMMDACYQGKRIRDMLPPLPDGVASSFIQYLDIIEKLEKQLSELTAAKKENTKQTEAEKELASLVKKYSKATEMTQELADAMIESMQLHDDNSVSITFRYMDEFKAVMESIETLRKEVA